MSPSSSPEQPFEQLKLKFVDYIQHDYELIRPIVLFAERIAERSRQTGVERTVVGDKARRFAQDGMLGLVDQRSQKAGPPEAKDTSIRNPLPLTSCT